MILFKQADDLRQYLDSCRARGLSWGFVPTMGALHQGHISLINASQAKEDLTVCSIFVNPTQFNQPEDFEKYPVTTDADVELLAIANCDVLFLPSATEIYPEGPAEVTVPDLGKLDTILEGAFRPGHFRGVYQVMKRLLQVVKPDGLYMGQKDYQQCLVVDRLLGDLSPVPTIRFYKEPTIRELDGLARSSRNRRLSAASRQRAPAIFQALQFVRKNKAEGWIKLKEQGWQIISDAGMEPEYFELADAVTLEPREKIEPDGRNIVLVAAWIDGVRLIDNLLID